MTTTPPNYENAALAAIGGKIAELRKAKGWTGAELASKAGISHSHLSYIEKGRRPAAPATYERLAEALQVPAAFLTGTP